MDTWDEDDDVVDIVGDWAGVSLREAVQSIHRRRSQLVESARPTSWRNFVMGGFREVNRAVVLALGDVRRVNPECNTVNTDGSVR